MLGQLMLYVTGFAKVIADSNSTYLDFLNLTYEVVLLRKLGPNIPQHTMVDWCNMKVIA